VFILLGHLLTTIAKLLRLGGARTQQRHHGPGGNAFEHRHSRRISDECTGWHT